jgi:hypothetical protein
LKVKTRYSLVFHILAKSCKQWKWKLGTCKSMAPQVPGWPLADYVTLPLIPSWFQNFGSGYLSYLMEWNKPPNSQEQDWLWDCHSGRERGPCYACWASAPTVVPQLGSWWSKGTNTRSPLGMRETHKIKWNVNIKMLL